MKLAKPAIVAVLCATTVTGVVALTLPDASADVTGPSGHVQGDRLYFRSAAAAGQVTVQPGPRGGFQLLSTTGVTVDQSSACYPVVGVVQCTSTIKQIVITLSEANDLFENKTAVTAVVDGRGGADRLIGGSGPDSLHGGMGRDILQGGEGDDTLDGDQDQDTADGGAGNDTLSGLDRLDYLIGGAGDDRLVTGLDMFGGDGDDTLVGTSAGTHNMRGGAGFDTADFTAGTQPMQIKLDGRTNDGPICAGCTVGPVGAHNDPVTHGPINVDADLERVLGTAFNDVIIGNDLPNDIRAGVGNDVVQSRGGDDHLDLGRGGRQYAYAGPGVDVCIGVGIDLRSGCES